ncbi:MAG: ABC transporter ATP-binding protein [Proteobacteria bacterium]|nr:MAG: ABC transporter ATP-binding protein [Pseudomonadota bacterium]
MSSKPYHDETTAGQLLLKAVEVRRSFRIGNKMVEALAPVSLSIDKGAFLIITGPSGSGKSTLLNILSGLDRPSSGNVFFLGTSLTQLTPQQRALLRNNRFGFIFQSPHLLLDKTVLENTLLPFSYGKRVDAAESRKRCMDLLEYVGMAHLAHRYPNTLSGGEMQRVVFARAICRKPALIFADEPTGSLDGDNSRKILNLLKEQTNKGRTVVMVTHDPEAQEYSSSQLLLNKFTPAAERGKRGHGTLPDKF